ncbi:MAG: glycosyltransferase family 2 protein [Acidimicrobiales bacterium]
MSDDAGRVAFSAVIPTISRPDLLERAVAALFRCDPAPDEIVVVDGSPDGLAIPVVESFGGATAKPPIRHVASQPGLTRQRNVGLRQCFGDVIAFFDDDAHVSPDIFAQLGDAYANASVVGATGRVVEPDDRRFGRKESRMRRLLPGGGGDGTFTRYGYPRRLTNVDRACDVEFMQGCFMTARTDIARDVAFDESLAGYGFVEDEDFSCRLSRRGRIRYLPDAVVHHDNTGFGTRDRRQFGRQVLLGRSYLFHKNFSPTLLARAQFGLLVGVLLAHRALNRDWRGAQGLIDGSIEIWRQP